MVWCGVFSFSFLLSFAIRECEGGKKSAAATRLIFGDDIDAVWTSACGCGTQPSNDVLIGGHSGARMSVNILTGTSGQSEEGQQEVRPARSGLNGSLSDGDSYIEGV